MAALVAGYLLAREFRRLGWDSDRAWNIVMVATVLGFAGGKLYYLAERASDLTPHDFGSAGFTWYGGLIAGVATAAVMAEAVVAFALAGVLWGLRKRLAPLAIFGLYAVISGQERFLVEEIRINPEVLLGTTQPQVWSLTLVVVGVGLLVSNRVRRPADDATCDAGRATTRPPLGPPEIQEPFRSVPVTREL